MKALLFWLLALPAAAATYWVSPSGTGNGTSSGNPATVNLFYYSNLLSGDVVYLMDGTYSATTDGGAFISIGYSGITLKAVNKWKAIITPGMITWPEHTVNHVTVDGLQFASCPADGLHFYGGHNTARNCWAHNCGPTTSSQVGSGFIGGGNADEVYDGYNTFEYCLSENNGSPAPGGPYQHGFYLEGPNNVIRFSVTRGNYGAGLGGRLTTGTQSYYSNLIYGNQYYGITINGSDPSEVDYIFCNTVIQNGGGVAALAKWGPSTAYFTNNVILSDVEVMNTGAATIYADYNVQGGTAPLSQAHGTTSATMTSLAFVNSGNGLYWLGASSSARGAAYGPVHPATDLFGQAAGAAVDVGAFQYNVAYTSDSRTLDPSPVDGADYWDNLAPSGPPAGLGACSLGKGSF